MCNPWRWYWKIHKTQVTAKPLLLSEIPHAQLWEFRIPSCPLRESEESNVLFTAACLSLYLFAASFQIPHGLVPGGGGFTHQDLSEMLFSGHHHCSYHPHCHLVFSAAAAGPGLFQARQLSITAQAGMKEPVFLLLLCMFQIMVLPLLLPLASLCQALGKPQRSWLLPALVPCLVCFSSS